MQSTHKVEVVSVNLQKHPNADSLSIIPVFGYTYVGRTTDWENVRKGAYIPPDSVVDTTREEFAFLRDQSKTDGTVRIKAKKLRGVVSFGLMVPVPDDTPLGGDLAEKLGVTHYEPPLEHEKNGPKFHMGGEIASPPNVFVVKYDVDSFRRYHHLFQPGELVVATEKLDGANSRYVYQDGEMHCGSRTEWKKKYPDYSHLTVDSLISQGVPSEKASSIVERIMSKPKKMNMWWEMLERTPSLEKFCRDNPGAVVYGEVFGNVNSIKYGLPDGNRFAAFDIMKDGRWLDFRDAYELAWQNDINWVPMVSETPYKWFVNGKPFDFDYLCSIAEGNTLITEAKLGTMREGVVVRPLKERWSEEAGRVCFKIVSGSYLEKYR